MTPWTFPEIARLREMRALNLSYGECGRKLKRSRGAVASAVRNHIENKGGGSPAALRRRYENSRHMWRLAHPVVRVVNA